MQNTQVKVAAGAGIAIDLNAPALMVPTFRKTQQREKAPGISVIGRHESRAVSMAVSIDGRALIYADIIGGVTG